MNDVIGFSRDKKNTSNGKIVYGCRGMGEVYNELYNTFLPSTTYKCVGENFPWDYFIFENQLDEDEFIDRYINIHGVYDM